VSKVETARAIFDSYLAQDRVTADLLLADEWPHPLNRELESLRASRHPVARSR
jgi:hypothetical protein